MTCRATIDGEHTCARSILDMTSANKTLERSPKTAIINTHSHRIEQIVTEALVDSLDERGYLADSFSDIQRPLPSHTGHRGHFERCLQRIQQLEPVGVGARDLENVCYCN
ncbi:MAG: hypothetical protein CM1200mP41_00020 [Gammaproteobacteria bacterium]|nr:MAG: hypothetical protein CM1200mP41_00020 [Gammaproteobacteria bacterium]